MEIAQQAMKAAEEAKTAAEARTAVKESVKEDAAEQGLQLSEAEAEMIANMTIAQLEQRGAFGESAAGQGAEAPPAPQADDLTANQQPPEGQSPPAPQQGLTTPEEAPRPKSLAERFQRK
jgi:hypothetical protein